MNIAKCFWTAGFFVFLPEAACLEWKQDVLTCCNHLLTSALYIWVTQGNTILFIFLLSLLAVVSHIRCMYAPSINNLIYLLLRFLLLFIFPIFLLGKKKNFPLSVVCIPKSSGVLVYFAHHPKCEANSLLYTYLMLFHTVKSKRLRLNFFPEIELYRCV